MNDAIVTVRNTETGAGGVCVGVGGVRSVRVRMGVAMASVMARVMARVMGLLRGCCMVHCGW